MRGLERCVTLECIHRDAADSTMLVRRQHINPDWAVVVRKPFRPCDCVPRDGDRPLRVRLHMYGMQATANSLHSCLAAAMGGA